MKILNKLWSVFSAQETNAEEFESEDVTPEEVLEAVHRYKAVAEYDQNGLLLTVNENFVNIFSCTLDEVEGIHFSSFFESSHEKELLVSQLWSRLCKGKFQQIEFCHTGRNGKEVWVQVVYYPIMNSKGALAKIIQYAKDVTEIKLHNLNYEKQINAIHKSQAVVEFNMDGTILTANNNFLDTFGYTLEEVRGQHHSMFVDQETAQSKEYKQFWTGLRQGKFEVREYKRLGKLKNEIWIQASYNPIFDLNDQPFKVVKYATDITE